MRIVRTNSSLPYYIRVTVSFEEYEKLAGWVKENISTTDRFTPDWDSKRWGDPQKLRFRFRHEEHAMAFKLILSWGAT